MFETFHFKIKFSLFIEEYYKNTFINSVIIVQLINIPSARNNLSRQSVNCHVLVLEKINIYCNIAKKGCEVEEQGRYFNELSVINYELKTTSMAKSTQ